MNTKHTPTPWSINRTDNYKIVRNSPTNDGTYSFVAMTDTFIETGLPRKAETIAIDHANAEFIVRAVNFYQEFLEVAESVLHDEEFANLNDSGALGPKTKQRLEEAIAQAKGKDA